MYQMKSYVGADAASIVNSPRLRFARHPSLLRKEGELQVSLYPSLSPLYEVERGDERSDVGVSRPDAWHLIADLQRKFTFVVTDYKNLKK